MDASSSLRLFDVADENLHEFVPRLTALNGDVPSTASPLSQAIVAAQQGLLARQNEDGSWRSQSTNNVTLSSHMILLWSCLGKLPCEDANGVASQILVSQLEGGGWSTRPGETLDLDTSVLAYVALKLAGYQASMEPLQRARRAIRMAGGADRAGVLVRCILALLGQVPYDEVAELRPRMVLRQSARGIFSSRLQSLLIPLSIVLATRPQTRVDDDFTVRELFIEHPCDWPAATWDLPGLQSNLGDRVSHVWSRLAGRLNLPRPNSDRKIYDAKQWMHKRLAAGDALGGELTRMVWGILALRASGTSQDAPEVCFLLDQLDRLKETDKDTIVFRGRHTTTRETARVVAALQASGLGDESSVLRRGRQWLFSQERPIPGEFSTAQSASAVSWSTDSGSSTETDVAVTADVVSACGVISKASCIVSEKLPPELQLIHNDLGDEARDTTTKYDRKSQQQMILQARDWLCRMQRADGQWTSCVSETHGSSRKRKQDPKAGLNVSLTATVLEALAARGLRCGEAAADQAVDYLQYAQRADGSWLDGSGTAAITVTWQAVLGLASAGTPNNNQSIRAALNWLFCRQQSDGSWSPSEDNLGEEQASNVNRCGVTAGVIQACVAAGHADHLAVARGIEFLIEAQLEDGSWPEDESGQGSVHLGEPELPTHHALSLPLIALSRYAAAASNPDECLDSCTPPPLKLFMGESAIA